MGRGMAARLAASGQKVVAYDLRPRRWRGRRRPAARPAASAAAAVKGASVVVTMLRDRRPGRQAYAETIVPNAEPGALLIDCSTIDVETARAVAAQAAAAGLRPADAPVSGGTMAADAGTLAFMVGCEAPLFEVVARRSRRWPGW